MAQFISVIKSLIEHVDSVEEFMSVDVMGVLRAFADFLTRFDDPACAPIRMKFCALCDTTLDSLAKVGIRKDAYHRQIILEMIMGWLQDPSIVRRSRNIDRGWTERSFVGGAPATTIRSERGILENPRQVVREIGT